MYSLTAEEAIRRSNALEKDDLEALRFVACLIFWSSIWSDYISYIVYICLEHGIIKFDIHVT